ncbi:MAG: hypothetical protein GX320_08880 [Tissierellia bacterium]|nr:hypothetical protein [Tissierellia bacterium]
MSIRPVDYTSLISKSQEITKQKQEENSRFQMEVKAGFLQQDKRVKQDIKKVRDTNRNESLSIDKHKRNKKEKNKNQNRKRKEKKKTSKKNGTELGGRIDIKI